ncbi:MAG: MarP family serine protease [Actinomycetota bacterium]
MNLLDLVLVLLLAFAAFSGYRRGAALQLLTYGGLLVGLILGALFAPALASLAEDPATQAGIALATLLALAGFGDGAGWLLGSRVRAATRGSRFRPADAAAGSLVSVTAVLLCTWFIALNLVNGPFPALAGEIRRSAIVRVLGATLPEPPSLLAEVRRFFNRFGFPEVFSGLPPEPAGPVREPSEAQAQRAFDAADQSTVRIVGEACGAIQEGSGFVIAPSYVLTNAHVVAGVDAPQVQTQDGESQEAETVLYDPDLDLAVLRVAETPGPALEFVDGDVGRGAKGAVLGYPEGGGLTGVGAAVRGFIRATGRDIYGRGTVVRDVYELQAVVRPGNSGGPFVLVSGEVAGIVFAASTTDGDVGYAITSPDVLPDARAAVGRMAPVPTGDCVR